MKRSYAKTWKILYTFYLRLYLLLRTHPDVWFCTFIDWYRVHFYPSTFSTAVFLQRFSFLTVFLVQWLRGLASCKTPKETFLKFRSADRWKMYFSWIFLEILEFHGQFWKKVTRKIHTAFPYVCLKLSKPRVRKIGE